MRYPGNNYYIPKSNNSKGEDKMLKWYKEGMKSLLRRVTVLKDTSSLNQINIEWISNTGTINGEEIPNFKVTKQTSVKIDEVTFTINTTVNIIVNIDNNKIIDVRVYSGNICMDDVIIITEDSDLINTSIIDLVWKMSQCSSTRALKFIS